MTYNLIMSEAIKTTCVQIEVLSAQDPEVLRRHCFNIGAMIRDCVECDAKGLRAVTNLTPCPYTEDVDRLLRGEHEPPEGMPAIAALPPSEEVGDASVPEQPRPQKLSRVAYMTTEGFLYLTDIHDRILHDFADEEPQRLWSFERPPLASGVRPEHLKANPSGLSLYLVGRRLSEPLHHILHRKGAEDFTPVLDAYDIPQSSRDGISSRSPYHGLLDLDFTWYFAPAVANALMEQWEEEDGIARETRNALKLTDWADIIDSPWFSKLMHTMAMTAGGVYKFFGKDADAFLPRALKQRFAADDDFALGWPGGRLFELNKSRIPEAGPSPLLRRRLRDARIRNPGGGYVEPSAGCPVARYRTVLPRSMLAANQHLQNLLARGTLRVLHERSDSQKIAVQQDQTAIDRSLQLLACKLRQYDEFYGTPRVQADSKTGAVTVWHDMTEPLRTLRGKAGKRSFLSWLLRGSRQ